MKKYIAAAALLMMSTNIVLAGNFKPGNGWYHLQTMALEGEDYCLEGNGVFPGSTLDGATFQDTCQDVTGQLWKFVPSSASGYYRLKTMSLEDEGYCLEGNKIGPDSTLGGATFQDRCQDVSGQFWKVVPTKQNGYYRLQTMFLENENYCLEGNKIGPNSTLGGATFQDQCQDVSGQYWKFVPAK